MTPASTIDGASARDEAILFSMDRFLTISINEIKHSHITKDIL
jgi:hypothetical protein